MTFNYHPFIESFSHLGGGYSYLPPQMISKKDKYKSLDSRGASAWMKKNLDALETIGRLQYKDNRRMVENDKLVNGEFNPHDYFECEECDQYLDPLQELIKDGQVPKFLKHYDIISTPVNILVDEMDELPDTLSIVGKGDPIESEKEQMETKLLREWVFSQIDSRLNGFLTEQGIDTEQQFESEEEQQKFNQEVEQKKEALTPPQVKEYMTYSYRHVAELWGEYELEDQKARYDLRKKRREEFKDILTKARRFRHLKISSLGLELETWNPINVFYHKSPTVEYVQDGDYVGRIYIDTPSGIIDKFGEFLSEEEIRSLEKNYQQDTKPYAPQEDLLGNKINYLSNYGVPYNTILPSLNPSINAFTRDFGAPVNPATFLLNEIYGGSGYLSPFGHLNYSVVTEAYWKSQRKIGRLCWYNPGTLRKEIILVDEDFVIPDYIKLEKEVSLSDEPEINTLSWTWVNEIWKGIKINTFNSHAKNAALYVNIKPCEYQYKSEFHLYKAKLPVGGQIINNRNTKPTSFVDLYKPLQFQYNIAMNKVMKYFERSMLPFIIQDLSAMPNQKDWGKGSGQVLLEKWFNAGQESGVVPKDSSPSNNNTGNTQQTQVIDIDLTSRLVQTLNVANAIRELAMSQVGITPERLGNVKGQDTATGINTSVAKSFASTSNWFKEFMLCEKEILKMQLDAAQWVQSKNKDIRASYTKSDFSQAWLKFNNNNFNLYDLHIYLQDSQEELKQLELFKKLAIELNTVDIPMSSRLEMVSMKSAERIKKIIQLEEEKAIARQQEINQLKQQEIEANTELKKQELADKKEQFYAKLANDTEIAWIKSLVFSNKEGEDRDASGIPDAFEYEKFKSQADGMYQKLNLDRENMNLSEQKENNRKIEKQQELLLQKEKHQIEREKIAASKKNALVMDKGKFKG